MMGLEKKRKKMKGKRRDRKTDKDESIRLPSVFLVWLRDPLWFSCLFVYFLSPAVIVVVAVSTHCTAGVAAESSSRVTYHSVGREVHQRNLRTFQ
jgi:hypothetical protein